VPPPRRLCDPGAGMHSTSQAARGTRLRPDDGRLERGRRSRQRIRHAARELFREKGFDGATLRAIAARAGMGASSIYRHVETKEELLVMELADLQEEAWSRFRQTGVRNETTRDAVMRFFAAQHELLAREPDLTVIGLRATTYPHARVARAVLALQDRSIGLLGTWPATPTCWRPLGLSSTWRLGLAYRGPTACSTKRAAAAASRPRWTCSFAASRRRRPKPEGRMAPVRR